MKSYLLSLFFILLIPFSGPARPERSSFAIVVDKQSYTEAKTEIEAYAKAIRNQGLKVSIIIDKWQNPDSIRARLKELYHSGISPLEGTVLVGDIPVPMIRDAQHLSTAFKMDQVRYPWNRSSVPSDRFYDDFDLQFDYLKQDTAFPLYHYYSLKAESPQQLDVDIYSARIKPPEGKEKYELLRNYLRKVVAYKTNPIKADQLLYFTGHGYNSQDERTWMDEKIALTQQFDYLNGQKNYLGYINFQDEDHIKFRLMAELKRTDLDIALLHHHGAPDAQLLDGMPETSSVQDHIRDIKFYLRSKLRSADDSPEKRQKLISDYKASLGVPESWFDGTFDRQQIIADSVYSADLDLNIDDHKEYFANVPFIMLDACFTGSFHLDKYLSGEYIFDEGKTIVVQANTVNVLQDKWPDEMAGLLGLGLRAGFWHKMNCHLETHLIGDPTFAFFPFDDKTDLNDWINSQKGNTRFWKNKLSSGYADVRALALRMLFQAEGPAISDLLLDIFKSSPWYSVRMEAFKLLRFCKDNNFIEAINLGIKDSYELIQRFSSIYMSDTGDPSHIPFMIEALLRNNISKRVRYNIGDAVGMFEKGLLLAEMNRQLPFADFIINKEETGSELNKSIGYNCDRMKTWVDEVLSSQTSEKEKQFNLKSFRNQTVHPYLKELISFIDTTSNLKLKLTGVEMLGWFNHSYRRGLINDFCIREISENGVSEEVKKELIKTQNRIR